MTANSETPLEGPRRLSNAALGLPERTPGETAKVAQPKARREKHPGRFAVLNGFVDASMADLPRAELAVWLVLYRDARQHVARTGQAWIARRAGVDVRTVRRALAALERRGLVKRIRRGGPGAGPSSYRVRSGPD